jgi:phospholipid/cholesterol/gamma-HCH transport system substrate-binding protein
MSRAARLGAFIIATLVILAAGIFIIGSKEYLFSSTYQIKAQFDNVIGLVQGADVQVGGVHSGTVRRIDLPHHPGEKITVYMDVEKSTHEILKRDSVASIETEGLLGNQFVAVSFGSGQSADLRDGDLIAGAPPLEMADLLKKANGILDTGQQALGNVNETTAHLNSIAGKIDSGKGSVGGLINDKSLYTNLEKTSAGLQETVTHANAGVTDFKDNMDALKHNFLLSGYYKKRGYENASDLTANEVEHLPSGAPAKTFTFAGKQLFGGDDSAKLKHEKSLDPSGKFLAGTPFGVAVIVASSGSAGDAQDKLVLTQARATVVRDYLVKHFGFKDDRLKTIGKGKQSEGGSDKDGGSIQILVYPEGAEVPTSKQASSGAAPKATAEQPSPSSPPVSKP